MSSPKWLALESMDSELFEDASSLRFYYRKSRWLLIHLGSLVFLLFLAIVIWLEIGSLMTQGETSSGLRWGVVLGLLVGPVCLSAVLGGVKYLAQVRDWTGAIITPSGFVDRTQLAGPLPIIPWEIVTGYETVVRSHTVDVKFRISDVVRYQEIIGSSYFLRLVAIINSKIFGEPVHILPLGNLHAQPHQVISAIHQITGLAPDRGKMSGK